MRVLLTFVRRDGLCYPSMATLCDRCRLARAAVVKALEGLGLLVVVRRLVRRWIVWTSRGRFRYWSL